MLGHGWNEDNTQYTESFIVKTDSLGSLEWENTYTYGEAVEGSVVKNNLYDFEIAPDGGFICAGEYDGPELIDQMAWLLKLDACGDEEWVNCDTLVSTIDEQPLEELDLSLYPQPADHILNITSSTPLTQLQLYSTTGQLVYDLSLIHI